MYVNFYLNSPLLGVLVLVLYGVPTTVFVGRIFFKNDSLGFRLFYGFILLITLLTLAGFATYFVYDFSNEAVIFMLALISLGLSFYLKRIGPKDTVEVEHSGEVILNREMSGHFPKARVVAFLVLIVLSDFFLLAARTGESLTSPFDVVSPYFFVVFFFALIILLDLIFRFSNRAFILRSAKGKLILRFNEKQLILILTILMISVPASVYLLVLKYPAEHGVSLNIAWAELLNKFGRFVTHSGAIERQSFWLHKEFGDYTGHYVLVSLISKFSQISVTSVQMYITAIFFSICVPVTTYFTMIAVLPGKNTRVALLVSALLGFSQNTIFLFTPPDKPETYALGLLAITILFSVRYVSGKSSFILPAIFGIAALLTHSYIGQYSLIVLALSLYLKKTNFDYGLLNWKKTLGVLVLIGAFLPSLIYVHEAGTIVKYFSTPMQPTLDITQWVRLIFPKLWDNPAIALPQQLLYQYLNNFTYILYAVIAIGLVWSIRNKVDLRWIVLLTSLCLVAFSNMIIFRFFYPSQGYIDEWYRSFYALSFISFPAVGLGINWLTVRASRVNSSKSRRFLNLRRRKQILYLFLLIILASALTASFYGGFPRQGSMGPYKGDLRFPSDYDFQAINSIEKDAAKTNRTFLVLGDSASTAAALQTIGYQVINTTQGTIASIFLFEWGLSLPALQQPNSFVSLENSVNKTNAQVTYLIVTYRLGNSLASMVSTYATLYGSPIFEQEGKVYVFKYVPYAETDPIVIAGDNQSQSGFWSIERFGTGTYDLSLSDDQVSKISQNDSLRITIVNGTYQRFTLNHVFNTLQDWSTKDLLVMWIQGNNSGVKFNIVFRTFSVNDYYTYQATDDFSGWTRLIIPLNSFTGTGLPSWSNVTEMLIQFQLIPTVTSLNVDRTVVDVRTP